MENTAMGFNLYNCQKNFNSTLGAPPKLSLYLRLIAISVYLKKKCGLIQQLTIHFRKIWGKGL